MSRIFRTDSGGYIPREFHTDAPAAETEENEAEKARKAMRGHFRGVGETNREDGEGSDFYREVATLVRKYREDFGEEPNEAERARLEMIAARNHPTADPGALRVERDRKRGSR